MFWDWKIHKVDTFGSLCIRHTWVAHVCVKAHSRLDLKAINNHENKRSEEESGDKSLYDLVASKGTEEMKLF